MPLKESYHNKINKIINQYDNFVPKEKLIDQIASQYLDFDFICEGKKYFQTGKKILETITSSRDNEIIERMTTNLTNLFFQQNSPIAEKELDTIAKIVYKAGETRGLGGLSTIFDGLEHYNNFHYLNQKSINIELSLVEKFKNCKFLSLQKNAKRLEADLREKKSQRSNPDQ